MSEYPKDLRYTKEHEWTRLEAGGKVAVVGITAFAVEQLGDVTLVDLPAAGAAVEQMKPFGAIESVKAVSDLFSPLTGTIAAVHDELKQKPELVNEDPYTKGWLVKIEMQKPGELESLMDAAAYETYVAAL